MRLVLKILFIPKNKRTKKVMSSEMGMGVRKKKERTQHPGALLEGGLLLVRRNGRSFVYRLRAHEGTLIRRNQILDVNKRIFTAVLLEKKECLYVGRVRVQVSTRERERERERASPERTLSIRSPVFSSLRCA